MLCLRPLTSSADVRLERKPSQSTLPTPQLDVAARARLADEAEEFSPLIGWIEAELGPCLALEIGSTALWFGGEEALLERLRDWAAQRRLACVVAVADTLGAAWAVAQSAASKDDALFHTHIVPPGQAAKALAPLPVEALRLSPPTAQLLREVGLATIGSLLSVPREALAERFAPELLLRLDQALGQTAELFVAARLAPLQEVHRAWESGLTDAETVLALWDDLLPKLLTPLAERGRGVARLLAELIGESRARGRLVVGLLRPTLDRRHLLDLLRLRLESTPLREPLVATRLAVLEEAPLAIQQQVLFAELAPPIESSAWSSLVERLAGRLGPDHVVRIKPCADHAPERAWTAEACLGGVAEQPSPRGRAVRRIEPHSALPRPTLLLPCPRPIRMVALAPQGRPQRFRDAGRELRVTRSWGPERIETGWWLGASLRRDYYRVQTAAGLCCWVFRDLRTRRWFLHGWFD